MSKQLSVPGSRLVALLAGLLLAGGAAAQPSLPSVPRPLPALPGSPVLPAPASASDSTVLAFNEFLALVGTFNPVARQAGLNTERARQEIRQARGSFDPALVGKYYGKALKGSDYYHDWETYLRIPTWFGVDVKAGWDRGVGPYINPMDYTATTGLSYVGLSVPLGQGLLIDERRTALRVAQALAGLADAERRAARNKLLLSAAKDYWEWSLAAQRLRLLQANEAVTAVRFTATRTRALAGDLAAIDSVEALTALQSRQGERVAAAVDFANAGLVVSTYLWDAEGRPRELPNGALPQQLPPPPAWRPLPPDSLNLLLMQARQFSPDLAKTRAKQAGLTLENRLALNKLLPKLSADYSLLLPGQPFALDGRPQPFQNQYLTSNYKAGLSLAYPLPLRGERAKRQLFQLKLQDAGLQLDNDQRQVEAAVRAAANSWQALLEQLRIQQQAVGNYQRLRDGEQIRFVNGESTVFLINSRETKLLEARQKLAELQAKYAKVQAELSYAAGGAVE